MTRIKALLLGLGQIGCGYDLDQPFRMDQPCSGSVTWTHARALVCHPQVELVAAVDPSPQARERFSAVYACPAFADLEAYFQGPGPQALDLVVVAVPPHPQSLDRADIRLSVLHGLQQAGYGGKVAFCSHARDDAERMAQTGVDLVLLPYHDGAIRAVERMLDTDPFTRLDVIDR